MQEEIFTDIHITKWIGKHIHISVCFCSNCLKERIFICNSDPHHLVTSYAGALEDLALQSKEILRDLFLEIETTIIEIILKTILEKITQRHNQTEQTDLDDCDNETCTSSQFLRIQEKQLFDLREHFEYYLNVLRMLCYNSAKI